MAWDPERYHQFQRERALPFEDLLALVNARPNLRAADLGCGTGELTRRLADHLPESRVTGYDNSAEMLAKAAPHADARLDFDLAAIEDFAAGKMGQWDLILTNAALQWVDDHAALMPRLLSRLNPGGQLVVQMPANHTQPSHRLVEEIAAREPFRSALGGWVRSVPVLTIAEYAELLYAAGGRDLVVFEKVYPHVMEDADAIADWMKGTTLLPYMERLGAGLRQQFLDAYRGALRGAFPGSPVFFGFKRILFSATAP